MWDVLSIRTAEHDDDTMYPVFGDEVEIGIEPDDGANIKTYVATEVEVRVLSGSGSSRVLRIHDVKAKVFVTDCRTAVAIEKYEKGGGWISTSVTTMVVLNAASHARASRRRKGKMVVGQVRHQWLYQVGHLPKQGFIGSNRLRLLVADYNGGDKRHLIVDLTFPKSVDTGAIAADIARRAATYRLGRDETFGEEEKATFERLTKAEALAPAQGSFVLHKMPTYWHAQTANAHMAAAGATPVETAVEVPVDSDGT
jgi:hypothetical protein